MSFRYRTLLAPIAALAALSPTAAAQQDMAFAGLSVEQAIARFSEGEHRIFFSSDLVRPSMLVLAEPLAVDPYAALAEILAPHGLTLRPGINDSWLVVRAPKTAVRADASDARDEETSEAAAGLARPMEEIVVSASRYEIAGAFTTTVHSIDAMDLEASPDLGDDAIRAAARLPGMASNGLSAATSVRGGEISETLVRLDGARLYDPYHLRDFQNVFSAIDPHVVSSMDVYTAAFPSRFGARMSGVIDVESISPPDTLYHELALSFFNSSILSAGTFRDDRAAWVVSARRSNLDVLYDRFSDLPERPRYKDIFAKLGFDIGDRLSITANVLGASDDISLADDIDREERASARQTDAYRWINLDHRIGGRLSGTTMLATTTMNSTRSGTTQKFGVSTGNLSDTRSFDIDTLRSEWSRIIGARLLLDFGAELVRSRGRYEYADEVDFDLLFNFDGAPTEPGRTRKLLAEPEAEDGSLFAQVRIDLGPRLSTEIGSRWTRHSVDGAATTLLEPRFGLRYALSEKLALRASMGRFYQVQAINELQVSDGVTAFAPPQRADHFVLGLDKRFESGTLLRIEAYRKPLSDLRPRFENLLNPRVLLPELKPDRILVAPTGARADGIEISADGQMNALRWWGNLVWSRARDRLPEGRLPRSWDQTYTLNAGIEYALAQWTLSSALTLRSGWPTTPVALGADNGVATVDVFGRNGTRLNAYGSIDVRISRQFLFDDSRLDLFFEVSNLTGRSNPCCIEYEIGDEDEAGQLILTEQHYLPTIPSLGFSWIF